MQESTSQMSQKKLIACLGSFPYMQTSLHMVVNPAANLPRFICELIVKEYPASPELREIDPTEEREEKMEEMDDTSTLMMFEAHESLSQDSEMSDIILNSDTLNESQSSEEKRSKNRRHRKRASHKSKRLHWNLVGYLRH